MPLIRTVACAVDVTDVSPQVVQRAADLASAHRAQLLLVYVFHPPLPLRVVLPQYAGDMLDSGARSELLKDLEQLAAPLRQTGLIVRTQVCEGKPATELVRAAQAHDADLLVLGTHGRAGVGRLVLGSVAEEAIRYAGCPVLTIPPGVKDPSNATPTASPFGRILCPIDFSPESLAALNMAIVLAEHAEGTVSVLHVVEWFDWAQLEGHRFLNVPDHPHEAVRDARNRVASLVPRAVRCTIEILDIAVAPRPYPAILRQAEAHPTNLIAMGVRGRGLADMLLSGSTTNRVLREARCPVLTTHAAAAASAP